MTSRLIVNSIRHTGASADAITLDNSGNATFPANVTCSGTATGFGGRIQDNLIINGACLVAQRNVTQTGSAANGYSTVDRFQLQQGGTYGYPSTAQSDVASGTTPYTNGFRKAYKITNANQNAADAGDFLIALYRVEGQDLATSGWDYTSASSYVSFSFWVKSSVAQNFYVTFKSGDGTPQKYAMETGSLSADTWTKITKTIPGNSNLQFDNDNGEGLEIEWSIFRGTDLTGSMSLNAWAANNNSVRTPDQTSTWYMTNGATFEITGVQLEVGDSASEFQHLNYADTLRKCKRYYETFTPNLFPLVTWHVGLTTSKNQYFFEVEKRANPTCSYSGTFNSSNGYGGNPSFSNITTQGVSITGFSLSANEAIYLHNSSNALCIFSSEL